MNNIKELIDRSEFQQRILNCVTSEEIDKYLNSSIYAGDLKCKAVFTYGMTTAALLSSTVDKIYVEEQNTEKEKDTLKNYKDCVESIYNYCIDQLDDIDKLIELGLITEDKRKEIMRIDASIYLTIKSIINKYCDFEKKNNK